MLKKITVKRHQKCLVFKDDDLHKILNPGEYFFLAPFSNIQFSIYSPISQIEYETSWANIIFQKFPELLQEHFYAIDLTDYQVAIVYKDKKIYSILGPASKKLFWKGFADINFEIIDLKQTYEFPVSERQNILGVPNLATKLAVEQIAEHEVGLLFINGQFIKELKSGIYGFWKFHNVVSIKRFDLRLQTLEVSGQEILTKDKVSLRINLVANYRVNDPVKLTQSLLNHTEYLYKELQFALREIIGTKTLEELLADKDTLNLKMFEHIQSTLETYGLSLLKVGIKDIILPGDMKDLLNKVVEAEKVAQANLIKRREETAATRSLLNTAKLMEDNPTLLRLKELETLEKITDKVGNLSVYNGLDGLLKGLIKITN
jgi:regulator of protease activity HflC (stomatin/prohibitin superfamily)